MTVKFLIEQGVFSEDEETALVEALRASKTSYSLWSGKESRPPYSEKDRKVFFYGSCITAKNLQLCKYPFQIWLDNKFDYTYFHPRLQNLLNEHIEIMPYGSIVRSIKAMMEGIDEYDEGVNWVRSNSGCKLWAGGLFTEREFLNEKPLFPEELLIIAEESFSIKDEHRVVIRSRINEDGPDTYEVVTHSKYLGDGPELFCDDIEWVIKTLSQSDYNPFPVFILDVAKLKDGSLKVIEANSPNCSGLYNCDLGKFIGAIKESIDECVI